MGQMRGMDIVLGDPTPNRLRVGRLGASNEYQYVGRGDASGFQFRPTHLDVEQRE